MDNDLEFCLGESNEFFKNEGIGRHHSISLLLDQSWASYGINCNISYELWSGNVPDYSTLKLFGFVAYYHVRSSKLDPRDVTFDENSMFISKGVYKGVEKDNSAEENVEFEVAPATLSMLPWVVIEEDVQPITSSPVTTPTSAKEKTHHGESSNQLNDPIVLPKRVSKNTIMLIEEIEGRKVCCNNCYVEEMVDYALQVAAEIESEELSSYNEAIVGLFGLLETKVKPLALNSIRNNLCANCCLSTNTTYHKGGRIWVLWNPFMYCVNFLDDGAQYIHMEVKDLSTSYQFYVTMIYAFNDVTERKALWSKLGAFNRNIKGPWVICGDFNVVLVPSKRLGGQSTFEEMDDFQQCVNECGVSDCLAIGSLYTWTNKQEPASRVFNRLDRMLVNDEWLKDNPLAYAHFYSEGVFDHTPCVVQDQNNMEKPRRAFKYYNMWSQALEFKDCVRQVWSHNVPGTPMFKVVKKLKALKWPLKQLNKYNFDDVVNNKTRATMNLDYIRHKLRHDLLNPNLLNQEIEALASVRFLEKACAAFLLQKSKATWGKCCDDPKLILEAFLEFYKNLLGTSEPVLNISSSVVKLGKGCTSEHHYLLLAPVSKEEIKKVMFSIPSHKAAGPDGYSSAFFKDAWDMVGDSVCSAIQDFFQSRKLLKQLNHTLITLVPKCALPQNVTQFRPISCYNVLYKCISKLLCSRLSEVLPDVISDTQGGFIKGRSIVENILICQDIMRLYNRKTISLRFLLKVDLKKAYDSVSWEFLEQMLGALPQFIALLMEYVRSASNSLLLNGDIFGFFFGIKGLGQGDPLSPPSVYHCYGIS
ncbi:uncharacterized protein LOC141656761 [Silene latifolia]|uniref:uncharacterized protein LOC141656761 n=1 Tax=Silene latifolia TaxID=37657 RepID=UPI003D7799E9